MRMDKCMVVDVTLRVRGIQLEICLTALIPVFLDKPARAIETVSQPELQSLELTCLLINSPSPNLFQTAKFAIVFDPQIRAAISARVVVGGCTIRKITIHRGMDTAK